MRKKLLTTFLSLSMAFTCLTATPFTMQSVSAESTIAPEESTVPEETVTPEVTVTANASTSVEDTFEPIMSPEPTSSDIELCPWTNVWLEDEMTYNIAEPGELLNPGSASGPIGVTFEGEALIEGEDYTFDNEVGLTLLPEFLDTLELGEYTITVVGISSFMCTYTDVTLYVINSEYNVTTAIPTVTVSTEGTSQISQRYTITRTGLTEDIDLSKVEIRYYYTKDGDNVQSFCCDTAAIQLDEAPYYQDVTHSVSGSFTEDYLKITFSKSILLGEGVLTMATRFNQYDWSAYSNFAPEKMEVYYDGAIVSTTTF